MTRIEFEEAKKLYDFIEKNETQLKLLREWLNGSHKLSIVTEGGTRVYIPQIIRNEVLLTVKEYYTKKTEEWEAKIEAL